MIQVQSYNNNGLFRRKKYSTSRQKKKRHGRIFIRRSKIYPSLTNNNSSQNFSVNYRPQITPLKHRRLRRKLFNGGSGDDEKTASMLLSKQKQIDFTELEHIFDNAIRNRLPVELYKEKPRTNNIILTEDDNFPKQSTPKLEPLINNTATETRIEMSNQSTRESIGNIHYYFIHHLKQHKILSTITLVTLSAIIGFLSVFIFIK